MTVSENVKKVASLVPAVRTADANGTVVDTKGFDNGELVVSAGDLDFADTNETYAVKLQEGDQSDGSDMADVTGASVSLTADNQLKTIAIKGLGLNRKRYLRAVLDVGGTTPSAPICAIFNLAQGAYNPVSTPDATV